MARTGIFTAPLAGSPPVGTSPTDGRLVMGGIFGTVPQVVSGAAVTQSGSNMQFTVAAAVWMLPDPSNAAAVFLSPTDSTVLTPANGPGTGSRIDLIAVKQNNVENADADSRVNVIIVAGTAGSPGVAPATPAGYYAYAQILVPTSASLATACTVTILRPAVFAPADIRANTLALLNLVAGAAGQQAVVTADAGNNGVYLWNGAAWGAARPKGSQVQLGDVYVPAASSYTLTTSLSDVPGAAVTGTSSGGRVRVTCFGTLDNASSGAFRTAAVQLLCDGVLIGEVSQTYALVLGVAGNNYYPFTVSASHTPAAGSHTWKLQAVASAASAVLLLQPTITVEEYV